MGKPESLAENIKKISILHYDNLFAVYKRFWQGHIADV